MNWSQAEFDAAMERQGRAAKPVLPAAKGKRRERGMNSTERSYAQYLDLRMKCGEVAWYGFEVAKIRLADSTYYTPDWLVMYADGSLVFDETKGTKRVTRKNGVVEDTAFCREDAWIKLKIAAELIPIPFFKVWKARNGEWLRERI